MDTIMKLDALFEVSKMRLARKSGDISLLWGEYNLGKLGKLSALIRYEGLLKTLQVLGVGSTSQATWKVERRVQRGTRKDRLGADEDDFGRRFDDAGLVRAICRDLQRYKLRNCTRGPAGVN